MLVSVTDASRYRFWQNLPTVFATESARPWAENIWPNHFSTCTSFVSKLPHMSGSLLTCFRTDLSLFSCSPLSFTRQFTFLLVSLACSSPSVPLTRSSWNMKGTMGTDPYWRCRSDPGGKCSVAPSSSTAFPITQTYPRKSHLNLSILIENGACSEVFCIRDEDDIHNALPKFVWVWPLSKVTNMFA